MIGVIFLVFLFVVFYFIFFNKPQTPVTTTSAKKNKTVVTSVVKLPPIVFPKYIWAAIGVMVIAHQALVFETTFGVGWGIYAALAGLSMLLLLLKEQRTWFIKSLIAALVLVSLGVTFRANGFVQSINVAFILVVFYLALFFKSFSRVDWHGLWLLKYGIIMIPESIRHAFRVIGQPATLRKEGQMSSFSVMGVIKTALLTVVALAVFVGILTQADPIFAQIIEDIWDSLIFRVVAGLVVAFVTLVLGSMAFQARDKEEFKLTFFSFWDVFTPVTAVVILFGIFLAVQYRYLFGTHNDLSSFDMTYSEYVRKGFIELMWASFIGSLLTYFTYMKERVLDSGRFRQALKGINIVMAAELVLLVLSAFRRNMLYIDAYGLTRVRIVGMVFLTWLVGSLLIQLAMTLWDKIEQKHFLQGVWGLSLVAILALNVMNIDRIVFAQTPSLEDGKDYFYLANLSQDVTEEWGPMIGEIEQYVVSLENGQQPVNGDSYSRMANAKLALVSLQENWERLDKKYGKSEAVAKAYFNGSTDFPEWLEFERKPQSIIWGEYRGYQVMSANQDLYVTKVANLLQRYDALEAKHGITLYDQEVHLMRGYNRPFISTELEYEPEFQPEYREVKQSPTPTPVP